MRPLELRWTKDTLADLLDLLWARAGKLPSYRQCFNAGYGGGTRYFYAIRSRWCDQNGIENKTLRVPVAKAATRGVLVSECAEATRKELIERRPHRAKPYVPYDQLTPSQRAISDGFAAMKRLGLMGGKV